MPNKRAENIVRVTITLDKKLLDLLELQCEVLGLNRLDFIRDAIQSKLGRNFNTRKTKRIK